MAITFKFRRGTASTWTSNNPTLAAGEIGFETDTRKVKIGDGSTAWSSLGYIVVTDPAAVAKSTVTTKGDLIAATASATVDRLAAGADGYALRADSAATTGLSWQPHFEAGKNAIINGGFDFWQRGTSVALTSTRTYLADRFSANGRNATGTQSQYSLTSSESQTCANLTYAYKFDVTVAATGTAPRIYHYLENPWNYYGRTLTVSFYAKASKSVTLTAKADLIWANADNYTADQTFSLTTSFQRFSYTFSLSPSGTFNSATDNFILMFDTPLSDTYTIYITGVQLEAGSVATPFSRAAGTLQGELAACQRYYQRVNATAANQILLPLGYGVSTTRSDHPVLLNPPMRTAPSSVDYSGGRLRNGAGGTVTLTSVTIGDANAGSLALRGNAASGVTASTIYWIEAAASTDYLGWSAEL